MRIYFGNSTKQVEIYFIPMMQILTTGKGSTPKMCSYKLQNTGCRRIISHQRLARKKALRLKSSKAMRRTSWNQSTPAKSLSLFPHPCLLQNKAEPGNFPLCRTNKIPCRTTNQGSICTSLKCQKKVDKCVNFEQNPTPEQED
jgi:hypothetical protein